MYSRKWKIRKIDSKNCAALQNQLGIRPLTAKLLCIRGYDTPEKARAFLDIDDIGLYDPFLLKDMDKAVNRIKQAIKNKEKACIYGDYDVDGVTATTLLYTYLSEKGVNCRYFIPERISEGYGLSKSFIKRMAGEVDIILTVDTGITAISEVDYARKLGIDMIITDHHSCRETLPDAVAVVNPHREDSDYPFLHLAGVGVVFKLLCALDGNTEYICERYSDIVAIGTIADVMPLIDENRYIVSKGLKKLKKTSNPGLYALMECSGIIKNGQTRRLNASTIGYVLAPRINAAGRIASASKAVELLLEENEQSAQRIANELCEINKIRQATEHEIYCQAQEQIASENNIDDFFVLSSKGWHQGVIGVVASKISEKYAKPCIMFSVSGGIAKGSGRSIKGFSIIEALNECNELLLEYGGHELAAGLALKESNIDEFRKRINDYTKKNLPNTDDKLKVYLDCEVEFDDITLESIKEIQGLEPFGLQNPVPLFVMKSVLVTDVISLSGGKHAKIKIKPHNSEACSRELTALLFGITQTGIRLFRGDICDIAFTVDINEYFGQQNPQLLLRGVKYCNKNDDYVLNEHLYEMINDENNHDKLPLNVMPTLSDFRTVFRFLKREINEKNKRMSVVYICKQLSKYENCKINSCKVKIIFDVLSQEKIIKLSYFESCDLFEMEFLPVSRKINLDENRLLKKIKKKHFY